MQTVTILCGETNISVSKIIWLIPDLDELLAKQHREGIFAAVMTFVRKSTVAVATFAVGVILEKGGYITGETTQSIAAKTQLPVSWWLEQVGYWWLRETMQTIAKMWETSGFVGAGDGLALESITGLLDGLGLYDAMQRGNAVGAMAVQAVGDNDGYPTLIELETFMAQPV